MEKTSKLLGSFSAHKIQSSIESKSPPSGPDTQLVHK